LRCIGVYTQILRAGNRHISVSTRIYTRERCQVDVPVQGKPVVRAAAPHAQTQRGDLGAIHIDPGSIAARYSHDVVTGKQVDNRVFQETH